MDSLRKTSLVAGGFYLLTFVSIPTLTLYAPIREADYILGGTPDTPVVVGGVLEVIVALACIGTAIALHPVLKRQGEARALGFVAARVLEAAGIFIGVASILTLVALRRAGAEPDALVTGRTLVAFYDSVFLLSQALLPAVNALLLGSLLYQSRLVPRILPVLGLAGAPLLVASDLGTLFGAWDRLSPVAAVAALPIAVWEFSLGVYLVVKGFKPVTDGTVAPRPVQDATV
ncbi:MULTISPECIES: DUF4386 domain-containing protein [Micromonospora]|uniref:DUF4386 domain-containing protein n=1 Tax=Micromonospora chalcea TaxID=1874 RepID=A0ABX9YE29_MICCH|nr:MULTISPECIES: DUF4386 domain-containing protein [Micromonospora]MBC8989087.1 DUF4386 domain-containing protein [Micromonospora chalcea]MBP1782232.1 hypothetical protein [Micromonospora sp. HB375]MBQ1062504.1 DUF4386 domain-containing protein [Micromonospora sp. C41]MBQ1067411.1 DUF4386 domain-containing protein [Micromonospora sp. D75]MDH6472370.1 hypothetical protein [Micromonospora sp. H404/HB375]